MPLLLSQRQPFLHDVESTVVSCAKTSFAKADAFVVVLDESVFFVDSGGQPSDSGWINDEEVLDVKQDSGAVQHITRRAFAVGDRVRVRIDWKRRYDHMQCHSAQHLISAIIMRDLHWRTVSWWMSTFPNECHIDVVEAEVTANDLDRADAEVNAVIQSAAPIVTHVFPSVDEFHHSPLFERQLRPKPLEKIVGDIRVVEISRRRREHVLRNAYE